MYLNQLAKILEEEGIGSIGENIFVLGAPDTVQNYVLLMLGGDGLAFDNELPGYYNSKYQVIVRYTNMEEGLAFAEDVMNALTFYGKIKDNITFKHSLPRDHPRPYRKNEAGIIEFSNNFLVSFTKE